MRIFAGDQGGKMNKRRHGVDSNGVFHGATADIWRTGTRLRPAAPKEVGRSTRPLWER